MWNLQLWLRERGLWYLLGIYFQNFWQESPPFYIWESPPPRLSPSQRFKSISICSLFQGPLAVLQQKELHKTSQLLWMQSPKSPKHILLLWASSNIHGIHGMQGKARWHFQFASQICAPTFELSHNVIPKPKVSFNKRIWKQNPIKWSEVLKS